MTKNLLVKQLKRIFSSIKLAGRIFSKKMKKSALALIHLLKKLFILVFYKILVKRFHYLSLLCFVAIFIANKVVVKNAEQKTFSSTEKTPKNKVGLLLGTSKMLANGRTNLYYWYRVKAAVELYESGKINFIVVSGDNSSKENDEPTDFKNDLIQLGVPAHKIVLDYAGFRTLDSVVRIKKIFGQNSVTIISQKFHNERAIYLAEYFDIKAIGFNAKDVPIKVGLKTTIREYLARVKVFVDIVFQVKPKFLGDPIIID